LSDEKPPANIEEHLGLPLDPPPLGLEHRIDLIVAGTSDMSDEQMRALILALQKALSNR